jgi:diguanylate cyclase (GGDEF)-like protein
VTNHMRNHTLTSWLSFISIGIMIFLVMAELLLSRSLEARWFYLATMVFWSATALSILLKPRVADGFTSLSIDIGVGFLLLSVGLLAANGYADATEDLHASLIKAAPLLVAWWSIIYFRELSRALLYSLLLYSFLLGVSTQLHGYSNANSIILGAIEIAVVRVAMMSYLAASANRSAIAGGVEGTLDPVTGFALPGTFEAELALVTAMSDRQNAPFSILACEIDGFDTYVSQFGAPAGDKLLRLAALSIGDCLRISDTVGRWDGERFLTILPGTKAGDVEHVVEKMRKRIALIEAVDNGPVSLRFAIAEHHRGDDPLVVVEQVEKLLMDNQTIVT